MEEDLADGVVGREEDLVDGVVDQEDLEVRDGVAQEDLGVQVGDREVLVSTPGLVVSLVAFVMIYATWYLLAYHVSAVAGCFKVVSVGPGPLGLLVVGHLPSDVRLRPCLVNK